MGRRGGQTARLGVGLAVAMALHGLVAGWALTRPERPPAPPPPPIERIELTIAEPRPLPPPLVEPPAPKPEPQRSPPPRRRARPAPPSAPKRPSDESPRETGGGGGPSSAPGQGGPAAPGGGEAGDPNAPEGPVRLFDRGALGGAVSRWRDGMNGGVPDEGDHAAGDRLGEDSPEAERGRVQARLHRDLAGVSSAGRVQAGLVDPYFSHLSGGVREGLRLGASDLDERADRGGARHPGFRAEWLPPVPYENGSEFADATAVTDPYGAMRPAGRDDAGRIRQEFCRLWNDGAYAKVRGWVVMRLVQAPDGRPLGTLVLGSSGHASLEEEARRALLAVAESNPAPAAGMGLGGERIGTVWRVMAKVTRRAAGCFDSGLIKSAVDAGREDRSGHILLLNVELVAVDG